MEAEVITSLAHQVRVLRLQRNWTQRDLARRLGSTQAVVSRLEDPSYGKASIQTLLKLGAVFDVALNVRFGSFVTFFKEAMSPSLQALEVASFEEEAEWVGFHESVRTDESQLGLSFVSVDLPAVDVASVQISGADWSPYFGVTLPRGSNSEKEDFLFTSVKYGQQN